MLKKDIKFQWNDEAQQALDTLKEKLWSSAVSAFPDFDEEFIIHTNASGWAIGGVLGQMQDNYERPIAYIKKSK